MKPANGMAEQTHTVATGQVAAPWRHWGTSAGVQASCQEHPPWAQRTCRCLVHSKELPAFARATPTSTAACCPLCAREAGAPGPSARLVWGSAGREAQGHL